MIPVKNNHNISNQYSNKIRELFVYYSKYRKYIVPFVFLTSYFLFYFLFDSSSQSLVAHDEGLYARRARLLEESGNWFLSPFETPHHKTLGSYWLIALSIRLFGNSEFSVRLPSIFASFICVAFCYLITSKVANKDSAIISVVSLISMPLWIQYSKYASPDIPFVLCILLVIFFFLEFLTSSNYINKFLYIFSSGFFILIAFFLRSYMALVPLLGLSPFLIFHLNRSNNHYKAVFFSGITLGSIPTVISLFNAYKVFGIDGISSLFEFAHNQAIGVFDFNNLYLIPINYLYLTFPVGILFILFSFSSHSINIIRYPLLVYVYPFLSLLILLCMSKSYPHYYLFLLPSLSILFSSSIKINSFRFSFSKRLIKYFLLSLLILLTSFLVYIVLYFNLSIFNYSYSTSLLFYLCALLFLLSYLNSISYLFVSNETFNIKKFFYRIAIPQYFSISLLYNFGIIGSPNLATKLFIQNPDISSIVNSKTIYLFNLDSKLQTLLEFYLPSSMVIQDIDNIYINEYIITSNTFFMKNLYTKGNYIQIADFSNNFLLMKISK